MDRNTVGPFNFEYDRDSDHPAKCLALWGQGLVPELGRAVHPAKDGGCFVFRGFVTRHPIDTAAEVYDAPTASRRTPLGIVASMDTPPLCLRSLLEPAKVRGSIVEAQFACPPMRKLTVRLS